MSVETQIRVHAAVLGIAIATLFEVGPLPGWITVPAWAFVGLLVINAALSARSEGSTS